MEVKGPEVGVGKILVGVGAQHRALVGAETNRFGLDAAFTETQASAPVSHCATARSGCCLHRDPGLRSSEPLRYCQSKVARHAPPAARFPAGFQQGSQ